MHLTSLRTRFASLRETRAWRGASWLLGGAALCELAARVSHFGPDGHALSRWFDRADAGPLLRLYDRLAGFGVSRGTVAALGFMPYLSARVFTWIARSVSPALDDRWSRDAGRSERTRWTRGITFGLSLVQSYGFARFTEMIPGAVAHPGAQYVAETMLVQTAVAMFLMWIGEQVTEPTDDATRAAEPALLDRDASSTIAMSGQRRKMSKPDYVRHITPV